MITNDEINQILCLLHDYLIEYLSVDLTEDIVDDMDIKMHDIFKIKE